MPDVKIGLTFGIGFWSRNFLAVTGTRFKLPHKKYTSIFKFIYNLLMNKKRLPIECDKLLNERRSRKVSPGI